MGIDTKTESQAGPAPKGNRLKSSPFRRLLASGLLFLIIPITFVIAVSTLTNAKGPQWLPYTFENPYIYLFNSLAIVDGRTPTYLDHPGITTELFGALVLRASSSEPEPDLIVSTLRNPEKQIKKLHWALLLFTATTLWLAPWFTAIILKNNITGLLIQAPILFYQTLIWYGIMFGSDLMQVPFGIAAICCCLLLLLPPTLTGGPREQGMLHGLTVLLAIAGRVRLTTVHEHRHLVLGTSPRATPGSLHFSWRISFLPALTGLICALGIATKLTFFPVILLSLFCCWKRKSVVTFAASFLICLTVILVPLISKLPLTFDWIFSLIIHSGLYGSGAVGLPPTDEYLQAVLDFFNGGSLLVIIPVVTTVIAIAITLAGKSAFRRSGWCQTMLALLVIEVVSFAAIAKHPDIHYLISLYLITGVNLVLLHHGFAAPGVHRRLKPLGWIVLVSLLALGLSDFIWKTPIAYQQLRKDKVALINLYHHAKEIAKNDLLVDYYVSDSPLYPVCHGDDRAGRVFAKQLESIYPNSLFFYIWPPSQFETFSGFVDTQTVLSKYNHLYFLGSTDDFPKIDGIDPDTFETIDQTDTSFPLWPLTYTLYKWTRK